MQMLSSRSSPGRPHRARRGAHCRAASQHLTSPRRTEKGHRLGLRLRLRSLFGARIFFRYRDTRVAPVRSAAVAAAAAAAAATAASAAPAAVVGVSAADGLRLMDAREAARPHRPSGPFRASSAVGRSC